MSLQDDLTEILQRINFVHVLGQMPIEEANEIRKLIWKYTEDLEKVHTLTNFMIPKRLLQKDCYYVGKCRQAHIAKWDGEKFIHWREKFGTIFLESIEYWEEGHQFDEFIPIFTIGPKLPEPINE